MADPRQFPAEECERAAQWVLDEVRRRRLLRRPPRGDRGRQPGRGRVPAVLPTQTRPPCCSTPTTTCSRRSTTTRGAHRRSSSPRSDGRWYGRGAADCKGNIVMHLAALRALGDDVPVNLKLVVEGSEEQGTGGPRGLRPDARRPAARRHDPGLRHRQRRRGAPGGHGEPARHGQRRRHGRGQHVGDPLRDVRRRRPRCPRRPRRDAGHAARRRRATPRSPGWTTPRRWTGEPYPPEQFRADAGTLEGVSLLGERQRLGHALGATRGDHPGHRLPAGRRLGRGHRAAGRRRGSTCASRPGRRPRSPRPPWSTHLRAAAPWGVHVTVEIEATGSPFQAETDGPAYRAMAAAMQEAYGTPMAQPRAGRVDPACATCSPRPIPTPSSS